MPKHDLDALLGDDPLELTIGGRTWHIEDVPVAFLMRAQRAAEAGGETDPYLILRETLGPLAKKEGMTDGDFEAYLQGVGGYKLLAAMHLITAHFTSRLEATGVRLDSMPVPQPSTGPTTSPDS